MEQEVPRKLVLHFDISKVLTIKNIKANQPEEEIILDFLLNFLWGRVDEKEKEGKILRSWICMSESLTRNPMSEGLMTFKTFLNTYFPPKTEAEEPDEATRNAFNLEQAKSNEEKISNFLKPGNPGAKFKKLFDKFLIRLDLPKHVKDQLGPESGEKEGQAKEEEEKMIKQEFENESQIDLKKLYARGRYFLFPSFFSMMRNLKKAKREFGIVLRGNNHDLEYAIEEFNKLCEGKHMCFNGVAPNPLVKFDGSKGGKDYKIIQNKGALYKNPSPDLSKMVAGTTKKGAKFDNIEGFYEGDLEEGTVEIISGALDIYVYLMESLKRVCSFAYKDEENSDKLFLLDTKDYTTQQIYFTSDENIDVRELDTGQQINLKKALNKYVVVVETEKAILENDYFFKLIENCEKNRSLEIDKIEKGLSLEEANEIPKSLDPWEQLAALPNREYLSKTILPVLYQALRVVDIVRPDDPHSFIALYLLKHKDLVKIPKQRAPIEPEKPEGEEEAKKDEEKKDDDEHKEEEKVKEVKKEIAKSPKEIGKKEDKPKKEEKAKKEDKPKKDEKAKKEDKPKKEEKAKKEDKPKKDEKSPKAKTEAKKS